MRASVPDRASGPVRADGAAQVDVAYSLAVAFVVMKVSPVGFEGANLPVFA